jgi:hypothetical protein
MELLHLTGDAWDADLEMTLRVGDDLRIGRMVGGFNRNYSFADLLIIFSNVFGEFTVFPAIWAMPVANCCAALRSRRTPTMS